MIIINVRANNSSQAVVTMGKTIISWFAFMLACMSLGFVFGASTNDTIITQLRTENATLQTQLENRKDQTELIMSLSMKLNWYRKHDPFLTCDLEYISNGTIDEGNRYSPPELDVPQEVE